MALWNVRNTPLLKKYLVITESLWQRYNWVYIEIRNSQNHVTTRPYLPIDIINKYMVTVKTDLILFRRYLKNILHMLNLKT